LLPSRWLEAAQVDDHRGLLDEADLSRRQLQVVGPVAVMQVLHVEREAETLDKSGRARRVGSTTTT